MVAALAAARKKVAAARRATGYKALHAASRRLQAKRLPPKKAVPKVALLARSAVERNDMRHAAPEVARESLVAQNRRAAQLAAADQARRVGKKGVSQNDVRRAALLAAAKKTGNWTRVLTKLAGDQAGTGGRYLDRKLYDAALAAHNALSAKANEFIPFANGLDLLIKEGKFKEARALYESKPYRAKMKLYVEVRGDGTTPGSEHLRAQALFDIARANDEYLSRAVLGLNAPVDQAEFLRQRKQISAAMTYGTGRKRGVGDRVFVPPKWTVSDLLAKAQADEVERMTDAWRRKRTELTDMKKHGYDVVADPNSATGWRANKDVVRPGFTASVVEAWARQGITDELRGRLLKALDEGTNMERNVAARGLLDAAMLDWQRRNPRPVRKPTLRGPADPAQVEYDARLARYRRDVGKLMPGVDLSGLSGALDMNPLGNVVKGFGYLAGGVESAVRMVAGAAGGELVTPSVNFDSLFGAKHPFLELPTDSKGFASLVQFDTSPEAKARVDAAAQATLLEINRNQNGTDGSFDLLGQLDAITSYGAGFTRGNVGQVLGAVALDPLIALAPLDFLKAGRVAVTGAGGLRAALLSRQLGTTASDFYKLIATPSLGGTANALKTKLLLERASVTIGRSLRTFADMTPVEEKLFRAALVADPKEAARVRGLLERQLRSASPEVGQISAAVDDELRYLFSMVGDVVDPLKHGEKLAEAEKLAAVAARDARAAATVVRVAADRRAGLAALTAVRPKAPLKAGAVLTSAQRGAQTRVVKELRRVIDEQSKHAESVMRAVKVLREGATPAERQVAYQELTNGVDMLRTFQPSERVPGDPTQGFEPGQVERARRSYEHFVAQHPDGVRSGAFGKVTARRILSDVRTVDQLVASARLAVGLAKTPVARAKAIERLRELGAARRYLEFEKQLDAGSSRLAADVVKRYGAEAKAAINPNRVARFATSRAGVVENLARDIHAQLHSQLDGGVITPNAVVDPALAAKARVVAADLAKAPVEFTMDQVAPTPVVRPAARPAAAPPRPTAAAVPPVAAAVPPPPVAAAAPPAAVRVSDPRLVPYARELAGVDLATAIEAFSSWKAGVSHVPVYVQDALDALAEQAAKTLGASGLTFDEYVAVLRGAHVNDAIRSVKDFRVADAAVSKAFHDAGRLQAEGAIRLGKKVADGVPRELNRSDTALVDLVPKAQALRKLGWSVAQYDEARTVLGDHVVRANTSSSLRRKAMVEVQATGVTFEDAFRKVRSARHRAEAEHQLELVAREMPSHAAPEEVFAAFEEAHIHRDLQPFEKRPMSAYKVSVLDAAFRELTGVADPTDLTAVRAALTKYSAPPLGNRTEMVAWLEKTGAWGRRTADSIRAGGRVWSAKEQRAFFEGQYGYTPPWTDEKVLAPLLRDQGAYHAAFKSWGFFDDSFEAQSAALRLGQNEQGRIIAFGSKTDVGIKQGRTVPELRKWVADYYGSVVSTDGGKTLKEMPWLMDPTKPEYAKYIAKHASDGLGERLVTGSQRAAFGEAVASVTRRHLVRVLKEGGLTPGDALLPGERISLIRDITDELLLNPEWRSFLERMPLLGRGLTAVGWLQRAMVAFNPAFIPMNLLDRAIGRPLQMAVAMRDFHYVLGGIRSEIAEMVPTLASGNIRAHGLYTLRGEGGLTIARNATLSTRVRAVGLIKAVTQYPYALSSLGEDTAKLHFFQRAFQDTYDAVIDAGGTASAAEAVARLEARKVTLHWFPSMEDATPFVQALNEIVPFLTYNYRNLKLGIRNVLEHPYLLSQVQQLGSIVEAQNRADWEEAHPGVPMPLKDARSLNVEIGGTKYQVDLSEFSDWFRGPKFFLGPNPPNSFDDVVLRFIRIPHPIQAAFLADLFGWNDGTTAWGTEADTASWFLPADLLRSLDELNAFDPANPKSIDTVQFISRMLFFKNFGRISPVVVERETYFHIKDISDVAARGYLEGHPGLQAYFDALPDRVKPFDTSGYTRGWFGKASKEQMAAYDAAMASQRTMLAAFKERLDAMMPWDPGFSELKKERQLAVLNYQQANPVMLDVQMSYMTPAEWQSQLEDWVVDDQMTDYFRRSELKPVEADYKTKLEFSLALKAFYDSQDMVLKAFPKVAERLQQSRTSVEHAWKVHQEQLGELLSHALDVKIAILREEAKGDAADHDLISLLYASSEKDWVQIKAESFADVNASFDVKPTARLGLAVPRDFFSRVLGRSAPMPGLGTDGSTPGQKRYAKGISEIMKNSGSGIEFYQALEKDPWLFNHYMDLHPDKAAKYQAGKQYFNAMQKWVSLLSAKKFDAASAYWGSLPSWIKDKYYAKYPDKRAKAVATVAYIGAMKKWVSFFEAKDQVGANAYFRGLPAWIKERYYQKHPDKRARNELDSTVLAAGAAYFLAADGDKPGVLAQNPVLAAWLRVHGGKEAARRGLISAIYASIPNSEAWLKRTFRQRYPDVFGTPEINGQRRLEKVARTLLAHPELRTPYEQMFLRESAAYTNNLKLNKVPPKQLTMEHQKRFVRKRRARHAALSSHFVLHQSES